MRTYSRKFPAKARTIFSDALTSFRLNNDLTGASSLAFSATLALIPALFLLTVLVGAVIGSSSRAFLKTQDVITQLIPAYSQVILKEVKFIAGHKGTIGLLNLFVLFWSTTPLVADMRVLLGGIFRKEPSRPFFLEKLFDAAISMVFLVGLGAVAVAGVVFKLMERIQPLGRAPGYPGEIAFFLLVTGVVCALYFTFSRRMRASHLLTGAFAASLLWFALRPVFHLFLTFNPGYGFAFGSFKSLFVVIIWIYISMALFLFGSEIAASLGRAESITLTNLMKNRGAVPPGLMRHVVRCEKGTVIFKEGDPGNAMFCVLEGKIAISKDETAIGIVPRGECFGALSLFMSSSRTATAVALDDVELLALTNENITDFANEFPEFVADVLRKTASKLDKKTRILC
jgi:membrane protein